MKLLVLGGGQQGRVVASDLARVFPKHTVDVADRRNPDLPALPNLRWIEADVSDPTTLARHIRDHDLAVGALPSALGYRAMRAAIDAGRNLIDISSCAEDPLKLDGEAKRAGVTIVPDCGLAPGLSHLVTGRAVAARGLPDEITILVGGVSEDPTRPYGYVVTWSLEDLEEEYVRPARIRSGGRATTVPVFSGVESVAVEGVGEMEAFFSDGLRTLLDTMPDVREMGEKTLRWPGHVDAVRPLVATGRFLDEFRERCVDPDPRDLVVMMVRLRRGAHTERIWMVDRCDPERHMTAMSRTTAYTCSAATRLAVEGGLRESGVQPLERIGEDASSYEFITDALAERGVMLQRSNS